MAMLGEVASTRAAVHMESPAVAAKTADKLLAALAKSQLNLKPGAVEEPRPKSTFSSFFPKPMLYTGALALVLLGMSYFSRGALKAFGPTASQAYSDDAPNADGVKAPAKAAPALNSPQPTTTPPTTTSSTSAPQNPPVTPTTSSTQTAQAGQPASSATNPATPAPKPQNPPTLERVAPPTPAAARSVPSSSKPAAHPAATKPKAPAPQKPVAKPKAAAPKPGAPKPIAHKAAAHSPVRAKLSVAVHRWARHPRWVRHPWHPVPHHSGVRVYDAQGRPLR